METPHPARLAPLAPLLGAVLGALLLHVYLRRYEAEVAGGAPRAVLTVTRDLSLGESLGEGDLAPRAIPERYVEERQVPASELARVLGARVTTVLPGGSTLRFSDLDVDDTERTLSSLVRPGARAYTLAAPTLALDGLLRAGDRVDVLYTSAEAARAATTLLENLLVLTVGSLEREPAERGRRATSVTLSVSPRDAETLAQHERTGKLQLTLRNPHDAALVASPGSNGGG